MGLARRGARQMGEDTEQIEDEGELAQVRRQAQGVQVKSLLAAVGLALLVLVLPERM